MDLERYDKILTLLNKPEHIRNICLLAHVDHGKTTFADHLIASNGFISQRSAGKLRYMDTKKEEQQRGITIKSSCITLTHNYNTECFLINLIDSPGHIDFNNEVSIAVRLSDSAVILIDIVEGLCSQTQNVLRQAWKEGLQIMIVFNKMDRMIIELQLTPSEAYYHLQKLLAEVNSFFSELIASSVLQKFNEEIYSENDVEYSQQYFSPLKSNVLFASALDGWCFDLNVFAELFSTKLGYSKTSLLNTLWGNYFINIKEKKIRNDAQVLNKPPIFVSLILENIWNVYHKLLTKKELKDAEKIFTNLNIEPPPKSLSSYEPKTLLIYIMQKWLPISQIFLNAVCDSLTDPIHLSQNRLDTLIPPSPTSINHDNFQFYRNCLLKKSSEDSPLIAFICKMFKAESYTKTQSSSNKSLISCDNTFNNGNDAVTIKNFHQKILERKEKIRLYKARFNNNIPLVNVSSPEPEDSRKETDLNQDNNSIENNYKSLALCKIFSGYLEATSYFVATSHNNNNSDQSGQSIASIRNIFFCCGGTENFFEILPEIDCGKNHFIGPGNIVIVEIEYLNQNDFHLKENTMNGRCDILPKYLTISSKPDCPPLSSLFYCNQPLLEVAIEPKKISRYNTLKRALEIFCNTDPSSLYYLSDSGQLVLKVVGEVHLEHSLLELSQIIAHLELSQQTSNCTEIEDSEYPDIENFLEQFTVSEPIVPFRETIALPYYSFLKPSDQNQFLNSQDKVLYDLKILRVLPDSFRHYFIKLEFEILPIPQLITEWLENFGDFLPNLFSCENDKTKCSQINLQRSLKGLVNLCKELCDCERAKRVKKIYSRKFYLDKHENELLEGGNNDENEDFMDEQKSSKNLMTETCSLPSNSITASHGLKNSKKGVSKVQSKSCDMFCWCQLAFWIDKYRLDIDKSTKPSLYDENVCHIYGTCDVIDVTQGPNLLCCNLPSIISSTPETLHDPMTMRGDHLIKSLFQQHTLPGLKGAFKQFTSQGPLGEEKMRSVMIIVKDVCVTYEDDISKAANTFISLNNLAQRCSKISVNLHYGTEDKTKEGHSIELKALKHCLHYLSTQTFKAPIGHNVDNSVGLLSGRILSEIKDEFIQAFLNSSPRLMLATYVCLIQTKIEALGKMYIVLNQRYGKVLGEDCVEGTQLFNVRAHLPVIESFGFARELRKKTSGLANPQLNYSHWELLDENPITMSDLHHIFPNYDSEIYISSLSKADGNDKDDFEDEEESSGIERNRAQRYLYKIRTRKGLSIPEKLVEKAEKQRTLKKNV